MIEINSFSIFYSHSVGNKLITGNKYTNIGAGPIIFSKATFSELIKLSGDVGARYIIKQYPNDVATVDFEMGYSDVDTQEDYIKLQQYKK